MARLWSATKCSQIEVFWNSRVKNSGGIQTDDESSEGHQRITEWITHSDSNNLRLWFGPPKVRVTWTSRYMLVPMSATHKGLLLRSDLSSNFPMEKKSSNVKCIGNQHETTRKDSLGNGNILSIVVLVKYPDCSLNPLFILSFPCNTQQVNLDKWY